MPSDLSARHALTARVSQRRCQYLFRYIFSSLALSASSALFQAELARGLLHSGLTISNHIASREPKKAAVQKSTLKPAQPMLKKRSNALMPL